MVKSRSKEKQLNFEFKQTIQKKICRKDQVLGENWAGRKEIQPIVSIMAMLFVKVQKNRKKMTFGFIIRISMRQNRCLKVEKKEQIKMTADTEERRQQKTNNQWMPN